LNPKKYPGVSFEDLLGIENMFNIEIIVVDYREDKSVVTKWLTKKKGKREDSIPKYQQSSFWMDKKHIAIDTGLFVRDVWGEVYATTR
jgi:hypothetical protein